MELDAFIRSLVRRWYIPVLFVGLAVLGVWTYHSYTEVKTATATVVVLTSSPAPGEFVPAQFGFDAIDESSLLAERVAARLDDGTTAAELESRISVSLRIDPSQRSTTPMYIVSGKDADADRAILIADLATEEGKQLYGELNSFDREDVRRAFQEEIDRAGANVTAARGDLVTFLAENDAYALPSRTSQQLTLVSQLELSSLNGIADPASGSLDDEPSLAEARAELDRLAALEPEYNRLQFEVDLAETAVARLELRASELKLAGPGSEEDLVEATTQLGIERERLVDAQDALGQFQSVNAVTNLTGAVQTQLGLVNQLVVSQAAANDNASTLQNALVTEEAELGRLLSLEPEYSRLTLTLGNAEDVQVSLERQVLSIVAGQTLPAEAQVKIFDSAEIQSNAFSKMLMYALGFTLAILLSLSIVYLYAQFERLPPTIEELEETFGLTVTTQVPNNTA